MQHCFTASPSLRQTDVEIAKVGMMWLELKAMGEGKWYGASQSSPGVMPVDSAFGPLRNGAEELRTTWKANDIYLSSGLRYVPETTPTSCRMRNIF